MILIFIELIVLLVIAIVYIFLGIYIKSLEFSFGIKGFYFKIEIKEKVLNPTKISTFYV